jgi:type IV secretion system protein VirB9
MKKLYPIIVIVLVIAACVPQNTVKNASFVAAKKMHEPQTAVTIKEPTVQAPAQPVKVEKFVPVKDMKKQPASAVIEKANRKAAQRPTSDKTINAITVYDYLPGALYQLYCSPVHITDIMLQEGEQLTAAAAGDTVRWMVADTESGHGNEKRVHVLIKPIQSGLSTNLVIATDRHIYHLEAKSYAHTYQAAVQWNYPHERFELLRKRQAQSIDQAQNTIAGVNLQNLNFDYRIAGDAAFKPTRVFDDGQKTYIEFPEGIKSAELPPLFIMSREDKPQIVNYRFKSRFYIVDRLFETAMLAIGEKDQEKVYLYNKKFLAQKKDEDKQQP